MAENEAKEYMENEVECIKRAREGVRMERLTRRNEKGQVTFETNCPYGCKYFKNSDCRHECETDCMEKLAEYEDAEEQGLLLRLPCKVGDTVWYVDDDDDNYPLEFLITKIDIEENNYFRYHAIEKKDCGKIGFIKDDVSKTVFLTKEEAEQALKQMGE